jgi:competence protein ComEA
MLDHHLPGSTFHNMVSKDDRKAALILLGLATIGLVVRLWVGSAGAPGGVLYQSLGAESVNRDSLAAQASRLAMPLKPGETIDVDRASATELTRLPGIGPGIASRIVANREANGSFGSLEELARVAGIGPTRLATLEPFARFSGRARPQPGRIEDARIKINSATVKQLASLPGIGLVKARAILDDRLQNGRYRKLEDLVRVHGVGPATVERLRPLVVVP